VSSAISALPPQQVAALRADYDAAISRKRMRFYLGLVIFAGLLLLAAHGAEVAPKVLIERIGNLTSYFGRIFHLDDGAMVWTDPVEWLWGWKRWLALLAETLLISYVGTLLGAFSAFLLNFFAAKNVTPAPWLQFLARRYLEFCRTVPELVFALIFVIAFGLGPLPGVLAIAIHTTGALGKLYAEIVENVDMKPVEGVRATGAGWVQAMRYAVVPQVIAGFLSYTLLRFEINVRGASVMGFVGAGGIGQELIVAIRKFYYSDVSAILLLIVVTVFVIDISTGMLRSRLFGATR
jgi:phosphonate transport system permease protein